MTGPISRGIARTGVHVSEEVAPKAKHFLRIVGASPVSGISSVSGRILSTPQESESVVQRVVTPSHRLNKVPILRDEFKQPRGGAGHSMVGANLVGPEVLHTKVEKDKDKVPEKWTTSQLPVVKDLRKILKKNKVAVVFGAPGTGKSEQVDLAVGAHKIFDLKDVFFKYYVAKNQIPKSKEDELWRKGYDDLKGPELKWFKENYEAIKKGLLESPEKVIVLDEFDLVNTVSLEGDALEIGKLNNKLAKELADAGKEVVLIIHEQSLNTSDLMEDLENKKLLTDSSDIVRTGFLSTESQQGILRSLGFHHEDADNIIRYTKGAPGAYLKFLKQASKKHSLEKPSVKPSAKEFIKDAKKDLKRNLVVLNKTKPEIYQLLKELSGVIGPHESGVLTFLEGQEELEQVLIDTGLVGKIEGKVILPAIVRDCLFDEGLKATAIKLQIKHGGISVSEKKATTSFMRPSYQRAIKNADEHGGGSIFEVKDRGREIMFVVPHNQSEVLIAWRYNKGLISQALGIEKYYPEENTSTEHTFWRNNAQNIQDLRNDGENVAPIFLEIIGETTRQTGAISFNGENNRFLLKDIASMERKVKGWAKNGGNNIPAMVQVLNDTIRTTFICETVPQMCDTVAVFNKELKKNGFSLVFSDKFKEEYNSGYVALHAKVYMHTPSGEHIMGEVQFHFPEVHDGTLESTKETSHLYVDLVRAVTTGGAMREITDALGLTEIHEIAELTDNVSLNMYGGAIADIKI
jgi:hypothetical protein